MIAHRVLKARVQMVAKATKGGGIGVDEAVAAADARVELLRADAQARVGVIVAELMTVRPSLTAQSSDVLGTLRNGADELVGLCGLFALPEIGEAATSLCRLMDAAGPGGPRPEAITVHLDALQLFWNAAPGMRAAMAPEVLGGLKKLTAPPARV